MARKKTSKQKNRIRMQNKQIDNGVRRTARQEVQDDKKKRKAK